MEHGRLGASKKCVEGWGAALILFLFLFIFLFFVRHDARRESKQKALAEEPKEQAEAEAEPRGQPWHTGSREVPKTVTFDIKQNWQRYFGVFDFGLSIAMEKTRVDKSSPSPKLAEARGN